MMTDGADHIAPAAAIHGKCTDIDIGRFRLRRCRRGSALSAMIVAMHIQHHKGAMPPLHRRKSRLQHCIIIGVEIERLPQRFLCRFLFPDLKPLGLLGLQVYRLIGSTIEIDFEARVMNDETIGQPRDHLAGEGIFLAQPLFG